MIALPIRTDRLTIRVMDAGDAEALSTYRSIPEVAEYQSWTAPFPVDQARALIAKQAHQSGPTPGEWIQLAIDCAGTVIGDVAVHLHDDGAVAEIGYVLHPDHQGHGYATESAGAVVDALFADGVHRIEAGVDPRNLPSRRVLERLGFRLEGLARLSFNGKRGWEDDEHWALLRDEREAWLTRPGPPSEIRLVELYEKPRTYARLGPHPTQHRFVATVSDSYADALFPENDKNGGQLVAWLRGIEADGVPAGFVMVSEPTATSPEPFLWRLMIDREHQGRGIGQRVIAQLVERYRDLGHQSLLTSWVDAPGGPAPFYARLGFVPTGEIDEDGEVEARLDVREWDGPSALG